MHNIVFKWNSMKWPWQQDFNSADLVVSQWDQSLNSQNEWYFFDPDKQISHLYSSSPHWWPFNQEYPYFYKGFIGGYFHMEYVRYNFTYGFSDNIDFIFDRDDFLLKKLASDSPNLYRILQDER